ncbi:MAG TPA: hypothetical protein VK489_05555 [Ferruginibacter sp.]|nr:hypothetical protein [Ferruginibacter sp.]
MKRTVFYIFCAITLFSCENSYGQNSKLTTYKSYFDNQLKGWTKAFNKFTLSSFKKEESVAFEDFDYMDTIDVKEFYSIYKPALTFSKDRNQFIDIYSYWLNLDKEGKTIVSRGGEPDQAITLCNFKTKKWARILFRGTTERIQDVFWVTNSKFILGGIRENKSPVIYLGDTNSRTFESFVSADIRSVRKKGSDYNSPKLLRLKIKEL